MAGTATQAVAIYATASKIIRRIIVPDNDAALALHQPLPGESRLLVAIGAHDLASVKAAVATATGVTPPSGRCCIVDGSGNVIGACSADPALDAAPAGASLVASDVAAPGDRYVAGIFQRQYAVVNSATNTVTAIEYLPIGAAAATGSYLVPAGNLQAGSVVTKLTPPPAPPTA